MAWVYTLFVGIATALALCRHCCMAAVNTSEPTSPAVTLCHRHGNGANCTEAPDLGWTGHFSECPEDLRYYCVHGECRYVQEQKMPSCRCHLGYEGSRCEFVIIPEKYKKLYKERTIIICSVVVLLLLILFIVFICVRSSRRQRRREEPGNGTEKLSMMDTAAAAAETHTPLKSLDSGELLPLHTDTV